MEHVHERFEHNGYLVEIVHDEMAENPVLEYEDTVKVVMWHQRYAFGNCNDFQDPEDFELHCKAVKVHRLPLYLYDHSGLTVSTSPFSCNWDSGQVGWVFVTDEDAKENFYPDDKNADEYTYNNVLKNVVEQLDDYLQGNVWGYRIRKPCRCCGSTEHSEVDSCWGFIGDPDGAVKEEALLSVPDLPNPNVLAI